jgi:hypothetical protein
MRRALLAAVLSDQTFQHSPSFSCYQISNKGKGENPINVPDGSVGMTLEQVGITALDLSIGRKYPELIRKKLCSHFASTEAKEATI